MERRDFLKTSASFAVTPAFLPKLSLAQAIATPPPLPAPGADGWVSLINGRDLTGWYTMLAKSGKGFAEKYKMVTMEEEMLHIMGNEEGVTPAETGYVATKQEFEDVHIRVEYKWGVKRHAPRYTPKRDNGLLYGLVGEDRVWPLCVECQIEEGDVGDFFMVGTRGIQSSHFGGLFGEGISPVTGWPNRVAREWIHNSAGHGRPTKRRRPECCKRKRNRLVAGSSKTATSNCSTNGTPSKCSGRVTKPPIS
jgi:Domain of Unknown Function (DUF1080)